MNLRVVFFAALLMAVVAGYAAGTRAQSACDAKILSIDCDAKIERNGTSGWTPLDRSRDVLLPLMAGDRVECVGEGSVVILVPTGKRKITRDDGPVPILRVQDQPVTEISQALRRSGLVGATRGQISDHYLLWPADGSSVLPEHFVIRWKPLQQKIALAILSESKDVTLWGPTEVDGQAGEFKSAALEPILAGYKKSSASPGLTVTLTLANHDDWEETHFSLLSGKQQQELNSQLDFWAKNSDGLALRLGRGYSFSQHKLFVEAADEYDAAVSSASRSRYVLEDALEANRLAGRTARVKELESQMAAMPQARIP